jgi:hypothetical protein
VLLLVPSGSVWHSGAAEYPPRSTSDHPAAEKLVAASAVAVSRLMTTRRKLVTALFRRSRRWRAVKINGVLSASR